MGGRALTIRTDVPAAELRRLTHHEKDRAAAARMQAIAGAPEGLPRAEAARPGGVGGDGGRARGAPGGGGGTAGGYGAAGAARRGGALQRRGPCRTARPTSLGSASAAGRDAKGGAEASGAGRARRGGHGPERLDFGGAVPRGRDGAGAG